MIDTAIPKVAATGASDSKRPSTANFAAQYASLNGWPTTPPTEVTVRIRPAPFAAGRGAPAGTSAPPRRIGRHDLVELVERELLEGPQEAGTGIVYQHIDGAVVVEYIANTRPGCGIVGDVEGAHVEGGAGLGRPGGERVGLLQVAQGGDHPHASVREGDGALEADAVDVPVTSATGVGSACIDALWQLGPRSVPLGCSAVGPGVDDTGP